MNVSPNIYILKIKFEKTETRFCTRKSNDNNDPVTVKKPCTFLLAKEKTWKRIFNANSELSQNCTEKQFMPSKTGVNRLYNDIWCYLASACFDWKIDIFQQTVVRIYYILNWRKAFESLSVDSRVEHNTYVIMHSCTIFS